MAVRVIFPLLRLEFLLRAKMFNTQNLKLLLSTIMVSHLSFFIHTHSASQSTVGVSDFSKAGVFFFPRVIEFFPKLNKNVLNKSAGRIIGRVELSHLYNNGRILLECLNA